MENGKNNETVMYAEDGFDINVWMQGAMKHTPWWAMSVVSHAIVVIILAAIFVPAEAKPSVIQQSTYTVPKQDNEIVFEKKEPLKNQEIRVEQEDEEERPEEYTDECDETDDDEEFEMAKGLDNLHANVLSENKYNFEVIGCGPGGGGRDGSPWSGRNEKRKGNGTTDKTDNAVKNALAWLAKHQNADGSWDCDGFHNMCKGGQCPGTGYPENDTGVTGLAMLAFLGYGFTHMSNDKLDGISAGDVIKKGLRWLISHQDKDGCFGPQSGKFMYNHCIAALALAEAYGMTESHLFKDSAQRGLDFISHSQNQGATGFKAWRYQSKPADNDTSVTGWAVMALKAGRMAKLVTAQASFDGAMSWITEVTDETYYSTGYNGRETGKVFVPDMNENWAGHEAMTAVGMMCRIFTNYDRKDPALKGGTNLLVRDLPLYDAKKQTEKTIDYYYWYYGTLALFQVDGPSAGNPKGGADWQKWEGAMVNALLPSQRQKSDGCLSGSWDSDVDRWGFEGGRVYATAINALTLEIYYRYPNAFTGGEKTKDGK